MGKDDFFLSAQLALACNLPAEEGFDFVETLDDLDEFNGIDCRNHDEASAISKQAIQNPAKG